MSGQLETISDQEAQRIICNTLGWSAQAPALPERVRLAEALRLSLWLHWHPSHTPVYISRVLSSAERLLACWSEATQAKAMVANHQHPLFETLRAVLGDLEQIGDIARLPQGYLVPAPMRCVNLAAAQRWLLIGGLPSALLPEPLLRVREHRSLARVICQSPAQLGLSLPQQPEHA